MTVRKYFFLISATVILFVCFAGIFRPHALYALFFLIPLFLLGLYDVLQRHSNILRNYPLLGHFRYILLKIRPQIRQYFVESEMEGTPYSHEQRMLIQERGLKTNDNTPFGTLSNVYAPGYEWLTQSLAPKNIPDEEMKVVFGGDACTKPYTASRLNISAMSFGALGGRAIMALNKGAKLGGFAHNTGEGGLTPYHLKNGGDIFMQVGTGYFGCRDRETGEFDAAMFTEKAQLDVVKMIEIKLSQGAKPAHGGVLPGAKVSAEIAAIRHVKEGVDCISPPAHSAFSTPLEMMAFIQQLRELSGGKPIGFKLCLGVPSEFMAICKAMLKTGIYPDFITIDGAEGGTGAAPVEFTNSIGVPLNEGLAFVNNCLVGMNVRDKVKVIASGKVVTGFDFAKKLALGADCCNMARPMMFSLGCVQSRRCHNNTCPTGVATQDKALGSALDVDSKAEQVCNFHESTLYNLREVLGAAGLEHPDQLLPSHIWRRLDNDLGMKSYAQLYKFLKPGALLDDGFDWHFSADWHAASAESFSPIISKSIR